MTKQPKSRVSDRSPAFRRLPLLLTVGLWLGTATPPLVAQDDPFATAPVRPATGAPQPPASDDAPQTLPPIPADLPESSRLVIESIRKANPLTLEDLTRSIRTMLDIDQFAEAKYYLARVQDRLTDDAQRLKFEQLAGANLILEIRMNPELQPLGASVIENTLEGARRAAFAPARLETLIDQLSDASTVVQSDALRELRKLGSPAAAKIISRFADDQRESEFPVLRSALKSLGDSAVPPLVGAARAPVARVQIEAFRALSAYRTPAARDALLRAYLSPRLPESLRRTALDALQSEKRMAADPQLAREILTRRAWDLLTGRVKIPQSDRDNQILWRWDSKSSELSPLKLDVATVARVRAAGLASDLFELDPSDPDARKLFLLSQLEASKRLVGNSTQLELARLEGTLKGLDQAEVNQALGTAIRMELYPAATGACELLGQMGQKEALSSSTGEPSNLIKAILTGNRHLQFAAFQAIAKIDPEKAFDGSSYMTMLAAFLASGGGPSQGIVGHYLENLAQTTAAQLERVGYQGLAAASSRELFELATSHPDVQLLMISDTLQQPDAIQLIQQLRRDGRTRQLPLAILISDQVSQRRMERLFRNQPGIWIFPLAPDASLLQLHVQEMESYHADQPVTAVDRQRHAIAAIEWLARIAGDRERYSFYELGPYEKSLTQLIYVPGFASEAATILTALGTPAAQREMVNFASQNNLPLDERKPIAEAFIESIRRSGTLLTTDEIQMQYDRYNASQYESETNQELLGSILDAIEAQSGIRN